MEHGTTHMPSQKEQHFDWPRLIQDFISSGLRQIEYCREHGLKPEQFCYHYLKWRRQQESKQSSFFEVTIPQPNKITVDFKLKLENGNELFIPQGFIPQEVEQLLVVVRKTLC